MAPFMRPSASFKTSSTSSIMASIPFYAHAKEENYIYHDQNHSRRFLPIPHPMSTTVHVRTQKFSVRDAPKPLQVCRQIVPSQRLPERLLPKSSRPEWVSCFPCTV